MKYFEMKPLCRYDDISITYSNSFNYQPLKLTDYLLKDLEKRYGGEFGLTIEDMKKFGEFEITAQDKALLNKKLKERFDDIMNGFNDDIMLSLTNAISFMYNSKVNHIITNEDENKEDICLDLYDSNGEIGLLSIRVKEFDTLKFNIYYSLSFDDFKKYFNLGGRL